MMKHIIPSGIMTMACLLSLPISAQVDEKLKADIIRTGYIHSPLPIDESKAYETVYAPTKKVLRSTLLCDMEDASLWKHVGIGQIAMTSERSKTGSHSLRLEAPAHPEKILGWGLGRGTCMAVYDVGGKDWTAYNRLHFYVYPTCEGARSIYLNLYIENEGKVKVPDKYGREGYHEINLKNNQWNECWVEISGLSRDKISCIKFAIEVFGKESTMEGTLRFDVDDVQLQTVENPETVRGWQPAQDRILFSTTGYGTESSKTAIVSVKDNDGQFSLKDARTGAVVFNGKINKGKTALGEFETIDFSSFQTPGQYVLQIGNVTTQPFYIDKNVWEDSAWRMVNFLFCERCGYPVPGKHGTCHTDIHATYNGHVIPINGGWHDAADMSQQTLQSGEISYSLLEMAERAKKNGNMLLANRLTEEALWGIDFILRTRLGDGYRAQSWGTNLWTDGKIGTDDDSGRREMHVHNGALENYLLAGIEAYAAMNIENDPALTGKLTQIAQEDFGYAQERFKQLGFAELVKNGGGHAAMASESQYHANMSWSASMLYRLTKDRKYADEAVKAIRYTLQCQRTEPLKDKNKTCGFFYRDLNKKSIVHYTHQSRDYAYMEALAALCETQPDHPDYNLWIESMKLYGSYLKNIMKYVSPYGMVPSGIYHKDECKKDSANFYAIQVGIREGGEKDYQEQLKNGVRLDKEHYLRIFPVWYSFRGNIAVHLSTGKAAAICARILKDPELKDIAEQQLFWIVGKNPFGQSLIYGEGSNYAQLYTALPGETVGEIPVGMQSYYNEDTPYWPQINTATYKEIWGASAARWLMLISEF